MWLGKWHEPPFQGWEGPVCHSGASWDSRIHSQEAKRGEPGAQLTFFFLSGLGPQPVGWYLPWSRQTFPPRLKLSGHVFADKPGGVSPMTPNLTDLTMEINCHTSQSLASSGWSQFLTCYVSQLPTLRGHRGAEGLPGALTMKTATAGYFLSSV